MNPQGLTNRFDIFERRQAQGTRFVVWRGSYRTFSEAEEKLEAFAAGSRNELYVKDLQLGIILAEANVSEGTPASCD